MTKRTPVTVARRLEPGTRITKSFGNWYPGDESWREVEAGFAAARKLVGLVEGLSFVGGRRNAANGETRLYFQIWGDRSPIEVSLNSHDFRRTS